MKTLILTTAIVLASVLGLSQSGYAATLDKDDVTTISEVTRINKIEVHGNVQLFISDGTADQVKVYNHYYSESALVQNKNGVLCISSYKTQKLVVWVTVTDLRDLSVYDNAEVNSFGKLSAIDLDVKLFNNSTAHLNLDAYEATIVLNDRAKADISGDIYEGELEHDRSSSLNTTNLAATHLVEKTNADRHQADAKNEFAIL